MVTFLHQGMPGVTLTKPGPMPADTVTCDIYGTFVVDGQFVAFTGTVTGVIRGKP